jgi:hypothetical protein
MTTPLPVASVRGTLIMSQLVQPRLGLIIGKSLKGDVSYFQAS